MKPCPGSTLTGTEAQKEGNKGKIETHKAGEELQKFQTKTSKKMGSR